MQRITGSTSVPNGNGPGKTGFIDANSALGQRGTFVTAAVMNALQEEVCAVIEQSGLALNPADNTQLYQAIQAMIGTLARGMFAPEPTLPASMIMTIAAGYLPAAGGVQALAQQQTAAFVAPVANPRIDRIVMNRVTGAITVVAGAPAVTPVAPALPAGTLPLAQVSLTVGMTAITAAAILDERDLPPLGLGASAFKGTGATVLDPGTGNLEVASPVNAKAAQASYTFASMDRGALVRRANGGAAMTDTLPGATAGVLPSGWYCAVVNNDASASISISVGAGGGQIDGLTALVVAAGQSVTITSDGANYWTEKGTSAIASPGQVRFAKSGVGVATMPFGGNAVRIAGVSYAVPAAGVVSGVSNVYVSGVAGQTLANSTAYLVYLFNNGGVLTHDYWPWTSTGHMTDTTAGNVGVEVHNNGGAPNSSRTLVGMVKTTSTGAIVDTLNQRLVIGWFNRRSIPAQRYLASTVTTGSSAPVDLSSAEHIDLLTWGDEAVSLSGQFSYLHTTAGQEVDSGVGLDGPAQIAGQYATHMYASSAVAVFSTSVTACAYLTEGYHYLCFSGYGSIPTAEWYGGGSTSISAIVRG